MKNKNFSLENASISSVHDAIINSEISFKELIQMYINRIEKYDNHGPKLNSIITINPRALDIAIELDREFQETGNLRPLHGIPVLLKDNINTKDMPTTGGSIALKNVFPREDAFITRKLKDAGAIIFAKVNLHEFAIWGETVSSILGQTLNPYDFTRTPGGSSGGTSSAIAASFGLIGIGTDTINSIRSPASACSLVGLRPTIGLVSRSGIIPYALTQDTAGPIMRTVEDSTKVLDIVAGYDNNDPITSESTEHIPATYTKYLDKKGLEGKRIGILKSFFGVKEIHQEVNNIVLNSLNTAKENGAILINIEEYLDADELVQNVSLHLYELKTHLNLYLTNISPDVDIHSLEDIIISGKYHKGIEENIKYAQNLDINTDEYNNRLMKKYRLQNTIIEIMDKYNLDAIAYPHQKRPVVKIGETQIDRNGVLASIIGFPSIVIPAGFTNPTNTANIGIPIGIEFLGRKWSEATLIEIAYAMEQIGFSHKPPIL